MAKRKRERGEEEDGREAEMDAGKQHVPKSKKTEVGSGTTASIQIVTGSYERALHGITAKISSKPQDGRLPSSVQFADNFLFNAHASAIRCLALSPISEPSSSSSAQSRSVLLASGGTDERVNVYSLSASPLADDDRRPMPSLGGNKISEDPRNRDLGSLLHHSSSITCLHFPTRSKLLSAAEDNTIAISRTKDLSTISTIKVPRPKAQGRPSGDTAAHGAAPAGVNDFAIHSSMKLMLSVGKGERCMRLWNLVTAKKAGVLNFARETLQSVHEGKYSSGEGRRIEWHPRDDEFAVAFEKGIVIFGADSKPVCRVLPQPLTKLHQMRYLTIPSDDGEDVVMLSVSTENGKILFYSTKNVIEGHQRPAAHQPLPDAVCLAQLNGSTDGAGGRIKDFEIIQIPSTPSTPVAITAGSDGRIRIWNVNAKDLISEKSSTTQALKPLSVGSLIGTYDTGSRITCMKAFAMVTRGEDGGGLSELEGLTEDGTSAADSTDDDDDR